MYKEYINLRTDNTISLIFFKENFDTFHLKKTYFHAPLSVLHRILLKHTEKPGDIRKFRTVTVLRVQDTTAEYYLGISKSNTQDARLPFLPHVLDHSFATEISAVTKISMEQVRHTGQNITSESLPQTIK